nr:hypothetical transcript [Hymenolepis microstoma]
MANDTQLEASRESQYLLDLVETIENMEPVEMVKDPENTKCVQSKKHGLFHRKAKVQAENKRVAPSHSTLFKVQGEENDSKRFTVLQKSLEVLITVAPKVSNTVTKIHL